MSEVMLALFDNESKADRVVDDLKERGYDPKDISVMMKSPEEGGSIGGNNRVVVRKGGVVADTVEGAAAGGVVGGLSGLLLGVTAIAFPGLGLALFAGPIAAALGLTGAAATAVTGAVVGAAAGGIVGVLTGLGLPEEEARSYQKTMEAGGVLLAIPVRRMNEPELKRVLTENGAAKTSVVEVDATL